MKQFSPSSKENQGSLRHLSKLTDDENLDVGANIEKLGSIALIVDGLGQAVILTTPDGRIVHVSRAAEQTVGYSSSGSIRP